MARPALPALGLMPMPMPWKVCTTQTPEKPSLAVETRKMRLTLENGGMTVETRKVRLTLEKWGTPVQS